MSATTETLRLIEQTSAHLRQSIQPVGDAQAACRQRLLQAAWDNSNDTLSTTAVTLLVAGLPANIAVDLSGLDPACAFAPPLARILLNLLLLAANSLPSGGSIMLAGSPDDLFLRIHGPLAAWPAGMGVYLVNADAAVEALTQGGNKQMALTSLLAHSSGVRLSYLLAPGSQTEPPILRVGGN